MGSYLSILLLSISFSSFLSLRKKKLPDAFSLHGSVMRHSLLKGISAQIVSAAVSVCPSTAGGL